MLLLLLRTEAEECTTGRLLCGSRRQARAHPCRRRQRAKTRAKARATGTDQGCVVVVVAAVAVGAAAMSVSVPVSHRQDGERGKIRCATHGHRGSGRSREGWGGLVRSCTTADSGPRRRRCQRQSSRGRAEFTGTTTA
jgi:hypothetical protein